jgi:23S rRNA pseudouridine2605 synthase
MRIQKIIADSGYCSRRKAEELIKEGRVTINGEIARIGESGSEKDKILVDGSPLSKQKPTYLAVYKPKGFVSSLEDPYERTLQELLPEDVRVYPAGRLDKDADGLLICTNDGELANKIMHPRYRLPKTYVIITYGRVPKEMISTINRYGVEIKDGFISDVRIEKINSTVHKITLHVGYHKVVKKIFDKFGVRVKQLTRTAIGPVQLGKLRGWRELTEKELKILRTLSVFKRKEKDVREFRDAFQKYAVSDKTLRGRAAPINRKPKTLFGRRKTDRFGSDRNQKEESTNHFERKSYGRFEKRFERRERR